ncbi:hypothetical protein SRABI106_03191 [Rahnella aquatilis]|nr:hypothetical protein SRABI106_03191 [Rahnella aquatilis]
MCLCADQRRFAFRQQTENFTGVFHRRGKNHHPFAVLCELNNLADDVRRDALLLAQFVIQIGFTEQTITAGLQAAEIVTDYRHIEPFRRYQKAVFNHVTQWQFIDAVAEQAVGIAAYNALMVILINPALAQTVGRGGQAEQPQARVLCFEMADDLLILTVVIVGDTVAFIDNQQGKLTAELRQVRRDGLHAAKYHFAAALLEIKACGEDIGFQPVRKVFAVVLRHQFFDVGEHQHTPAGNARQFGNHQTFSRAGRQHNHSRFVVLAKMTQRGIHGILLVRAEGKNSHAMITCSLLS